MPLILQIQSGSRAGQKIEFSKPIVFVGRHPDADLRFDVNADLDVSSRHAELRGTNEAWIALDLGSTNGTWVNGERITAAKAIRAGDTLMFGANGPRLEVLSTGTPDDLTPVRATRTSTGRASTAERVAIAVDAKTKRYRTFVIGLTIVVVGAVAGILWMNQRQTNATRAAMAAQSDSLRNELQQRVDDANARAAGFDSIARDLRSQRDRLTKALQAGGDVAQISSEMGALDRRTNQAISLTNKQIIQENGKAVAYIVVEARNKLSYSGTAFAVTAGGLLVTNRHVLLDANQQPPTQIVVFFADTDVPLRAHFVSAAADADIGFIQLDKPGSYPVVKGVASSAGVSVGDPVIVTGFPGQTNPAVGVTKRTTTTYGSVSKLDSLIQINAYAAQGSSGSPVFDSRGYVIGILTGGEGGTSSVLTWLVPSSVLIAALPAEAKGIIRK